MRRTAKMIVLFAVTLPASAGLTQTNESSVSHRKSMNPVVEIRRYQLKQEMRIRFHQIFHEQSLSLLHRHQINVVGNGPLLNDGNAYYLSRFYQSVREMEQAEKTLRKR